ncbi:MAG: hypothetical protein IIY06_02770 [Proteobacteria bacterium]|nr:hypothetical protein [Pseudomonadota bacterium]
MTGEELDRLFSQVFGYRQGEIGHRFGFIVDVPSDPSKDTIDWKRRRALVQQWAQSLGDVPNHLCAVFAYVSPGQGNMDLLWPAYELEIGQPVPDSAQALSALEVASQPFDAIYGRSEYWIALTQYSTTAPLKMAAARFGFKAATMPGFTEAMIPALCVDIDEVHKRVMRLAKALTWADSVRICFDAAGKLCDLVLDLRHRMGFASSGKLNNIGQAGNLPSGEAYVVPYEGEKRGIVSLSNGILPIEYAGEIALCEVSENKIVCIDGEGEWVDRFRKFILADPARANVAELGLGVLGDWGIEAVGAILLDEKLALHIATGRSEHLGGVTSPSDFLAPENVCHVDYVYHKSLQPNIRILSGELCRGREHIQFVENDCYLYDKVSFEA